MPAKRKKRCGARTRAGGKCRQTVLCRSGRCRMHGGTSTGPKTEEGKDRSSRVAALKIGVYEVGLRDEELERFAELEAYRDLKKDLAMARNRLLRAERIHRDLEDRLYDPDQPNPTSDELRISFERCSRLGRDVGNLQEKEARVIEIREVQDELDELRRRLPKQAAAGI